MDEKAFRILFQNHSSKLAEAWAKLTDQDLGVINGNLKLFLGKVSSLYGVPQEVILRELDAVARNIEAGIEDDFAPKLDPKE